MPISRRLLSCSALIALTLAVTACTGRPVYRNFEGPHYWQRVSTSESIYQQGPKAQQMLQRDVAHCVIELRELERMGLVKDAIPTDIEGRILDPDELELRDWDKPARDQHLYMEHGNYHDFESCMLFKGWERVAHVPYDMKERNMKDYIEAVEDQKYRSTHRN